ncbi:MAG TPA: flagellar protein FlaG [bacterium]|nr:flagellar protein FlaG [bacterium]HOL48746.1 flagellar protein FlaG [bacterium]HPQ19254.1 flagellar protein FlaG [bacterium]
MTIDLNLVYSGGINNTVNYKMAENYSASKELMQSNFNNYNEDDKPIEEQELVNIFEEAADKLNEVAKNFARSVRFSVHKETGRIVTEVVDTETDKVIREIPSKEMLDMIAKIKSFVGVIFDLES